MLLSWTRSTDGGISRYFTMRMCWRMADSEGGVDGCERVDGGWYNGVKFMCI